VSQSPIHLSVLTYVYEDTTARTIPCSVYTHGCILQGSSLFQLWVLAWDGVIPPSRCEEWKIPHKPISWTLSGHTSSNGPSSTASIFSHQ
jgi:hypothetical protein